MTCCCCYLFLARAAAAPHSAHNVPAQTRPPATNHPTTRPPQTHKHITQILVLTLAYLLPLLPAALAARAYTLALVAAAAVNMLTLNKLYGTPAAASLPALQAWAARALPAPQFSRAMAALMFVGVAPPVTVLLPPYAVAAAYGAAEFAAAQPGWGAAGAAAARARAWLAARRPRALLLVAQLDVALGFYMVARLFTPHRALLVTYFVVSALGSAVSCVCLIVCVP